MNKTLLAMFCIFLIVSSPVSAYGYYGDDQDTQNLGEALIIDVDHIEPTPIRSDYFQNREFNAYVFLNGKTLGTMLFGENSPDNAPFFGDMKIRNIQLTPNKESSQYISGLSSIVRPNGEELSISSNGDINLGYTRVRFKRMPVENEVPDTIDVDVTARIYFDVNTGFGSFGTQSLNLKVNPNEDIWKETALEENKIWGGRGYLRVIEINGNTAKVQLYDGGLNKVFLGGSETLVAGDEAKQFNLPGAPSLLENFLTIKLDRISRDPNTAQLLVEDFDTKDISTVNVVKGMKPFIGSSWEVKEIYSDRIVFVNDDGDQKLLNLGIQSTSTSDPCSSFTPLSSSQLDGASSKSLYCQAIFEYKKALDFDPQNQDLKYQSYIGIAQSYDALFYSEKAIEYYQLASNINSAKFNQEYGNLLQGIERRVQEKLNYFVLDDNVVSLLKIEIGSKKDSFTYFDGEFKDIPIKRYVGETLIAGAVDEQDNKYNWIVTGINSDSVTIEQNYVGTNTQGLTRETRTLQLNRDEVIPYKVGTKIIYVDNIQISESAIVTISPGTRNNYGTSEFTIHLPIEKRLWDWTPEEIDKMISSTEKSMLKLEKIVDKLGNVIKTWKLVCFSTFAILSIKNAFFRNPASKLAQEKARQECVAQTGRAIGTPEYQDCYNSEAMQDQIKRETESSKQALEHTKDVMDGFSWEDDSPEAQAARQRAANELGVSEDDLVILNRYQGLTTEALSEMIHNNTAWGDNSQVNSWSGDKLSDARAIQTSVDAAIGDKSLSEAERAAIEFKYMSAPVTENYDAQQFRLARDEAIEAKIDERYSTPERVTGTNREPLPVRLEEGRNYVYIREDGKIQRIEVTQATEAGGKTIDGYYYSEKTGKVYLGGTVLNNYMIGYQGTTTVQYNKDTRKPVIIPFQYKTDDFTDSINSILGFGNYIIVDERTTYHYSIWNPGPDGIINTQDDELVIASSQLQAENRLPGYSRLASEIERAYAQATSGSGKEGESVVVRGKRYATNLYSGTIGSAISGQGNCEEIMPASDCKILYNVCDPVMCPPSRFNLGGRWNVLGAGSVVQKGIIGSLVLGWGNGDLLPICLTGIHAGLENIYSMLGSFRDCLETSKVNGESVGICNEIRSLYMCDILWQEALALVNVAGKLSSWISTSILGRSGGGEYKFWESSWSQLGNSVSFFTKDYASSAFAAFTARSTDEIGSEICKAAIFGKLPAGGDLLGQLTSPESPPQFTGWFEEDRFTDVNLETGLIQSTSVGTGQSAYRVYYHIYAGRDRDITYRVVLKNIAGGVIPVTDSSFSSGKRFLKKGETVDKSFTLPNLPAGYTQMCIIIDGSESCGFGSISSSFSAEYLKQQIVEGSFGNIDTAEKCVPEQRNYIPGALTSGVRRVCSVYDPDGAGDEWEYVGSCGFDEQGRNLGNCYLYAKGVEQSIIDSSFNLTKALQTQTENDTYIDKRKEFEVYLAEKAKTEFEEIKQLQSVAENNEDKIEVIKLYHDFAGRAADNDMTSESFYNVGEIIRKMAAKAFAGEVQEEFEEKAAECTIYYDGDDSGSYDIISFRYNNGYWEAKAENYLEHLHLLAYDVTIQEQWSSTARKNSEFGENYGPVPIWNKLENLEECEILKHGDPNTYEACKRVVGKDFETGVKLLVDLVNNPEGRNDDFIKVKGSDSEIILESGKAETLQILKQCGQEGSSTFASLVQEEATTQSINARWIGKEIEMEIKGDDGTQKYKIDNGQVYDENTGALLNSAEFPGGSFAAYLYDKYTESSQQSVDFGGGLTGEQTVTKLLFDSIKVKHKIGSKEEYELKRDDMYQYKYDEGVLLKWIYYSLSEEIEQYGPFNLKFDIRGGVFGAADKEIKWNGFYAEGDVDKRKGFLTWETLLDNVESIVDEKKPEKISFICDGKEMTSIVRPAQNNFDVSVISFLASECTTATTSNVDPVTGYSPLIDYIEYAKTNTLVDRKCYCGDNCEDYANFITQYAQEYGVDPILGLSLVMQENSCMQWSREQTQIANSGCVGSMQICSWEVCTDIIPELTKDNWRKILGDNTKESISKNLQCGFRILKANYDQYNRGVHFNGCTGRDITYSGWDAALRRYNGLGCKELKDGTKLTSQDYFVENINNRIKQFGQSSIVSGVANTIVRNAQTEYGIWKQGTKNECDSDMQGNLTKYWDSINYGGGNCNTYWSAAFISYIMKKSGVTFPYSAKHADYFSKIRDTPGTYGACSTHKISEIDSIKLGDILCKHRMSGQSISYEQFKDQDGHCDIVVSRNGNTLEVIGGNVGDSVDKKTVSISTVKAEENEPYVGFISCT